jgi:hypothetical protein
MTPAGVNTPVFTSSVTSRGVGWYRIRGFIFASSGWKPAVSSLEVIVVDGNGAPIGSAQPLTMRAQRNEWLHYDVWIPCNYAGISGLKLTAALGTGAGGFLQVRQSPGYTVLYVIYAMRVSPPAGAAVEPTGHDVGGAE